MQCLLGQVRKVIFGPCATVSFLGAQSLWLYGLGRCCFTAAGALLVPLGKEPGRWVLAMALHRNSLGEEPEGVWNPSEVPLFSRGVMCVCDPAPHIPPAGMQPWHISCCALTEGRATLTLWGAARTAGSVHTALGFDQMFNTPGARFLTCSNWSCAHSNPSKSMGF